MSAIGARVVAFVRRTVRAVSPMAPPASGRRLAGMDPLTRFRSPDGSTPVPGAAKPSRGILDASDDDGDDGDDGPPSWWPPSEGGAPCYA